MAHGQAGFRSASSLPRRQPMTIRMESPHTIARSLALPLAVALAALAISTTGCSKAQDASSTAISPTAAVPTTTVPASGGVVGGITDGDVTGNVKTALAGDDTLKSLDIAVVALNGDVSLSGVVDNQAQIDTALKLARATAGAQTVHDELSVRK